MPIKCLECGEEFDLFKDIALDESLTNSRKLDTSVRAMIKQKERLEEALLKYRGR